MDNLGNLLLTAYSVAQAGNLVLLVITTTLIIHGGSLIVHTLQHHMLYCGVYAARHVGVQDVLRSHLAEYGPPLHAELIIEEHVSCRSIIIINEYVPSTTVTNVTSTAPTTTPHSGRRNCKLFLDVHNHMYFMG